MSQENKNMTLMFQNNPIFFLTSKDLFLGNLS